MRVDDEFELERIVCVDDPPDEETVVSTMEVEELKADKARAPGSMTKKHKIGKRAYRP